MAFLQFARQCYEITHSIVRAMDNFFFMEDGSDSDVKPYFYGSISFTTAVMFFLFIAIR